MFLKTFVRSSRAVSGALASGQRQFQRGMSDAQDVLFESLGDKGVITLNRPKALNSLNTSMVLKILPRLKEWEREKSLVIIKGAGGKAFCAGGDVRAITEAGMKNDFNLGLTFFRMEYSMNGVIGTYRIPYIALIDGIVMGGGVGLSVHGPYRVATERTLFAMPETAIGLFPDVGGSYFLSRMGGKLGLFLGLTGHRLKGLDVLRAGVATHYVQSKDLQALEEELLKCCSEKDIDQALKKYSADCGEPFSLQPHLKTIERCFTSDCVEGIVENLKKDGSEFSQGALKLIAKMSPTSMKITKVELEKGANMDLLDCLRMEYALATNALKNKDFYEGVRALLIDKDQNPQWSPKTLEEITNETIDSYFVIPKEQELVHKL